MSFPECSSVRDMHRLGGRTKVFRGRRNARILIVEEPQYYEMAFLQIPHSALPEKNSKDPPCRF